MGNTRNNHPDSRQGEHSMKVGDLVVNRAYQNYSNIVPAKMVMQATRALKGHTGEYIVTEDEPGLWKPVKNYFIVSPA
jgi:hypothetical protein